MRIFDYIKRYEKRTRKCDSQIYLSKMKNANQPKYTLYTTIHKNPPKTNKIFIGGMYKDIDFNRQKNIDRLSQSIAHEELHNLINKDIGMMPSHQLDKISIKSFIMKKDKEHPQDRFVSGNYPPAKLSGPISKREYEDFYYENP